MEEIITLTITSIITGVLGFTFKWLWDRIIKTRIRIKNDIYERKKNLYKTAISDFYLPIYVLLMENEVYYKYMQTGISIEDPDIKKEFMKIMITENIIPNLSKIVEIMEKNIIKIVPSKALFDILGKFIQYFTLFKIYISKNDYYTNPDTENTLSHFSDIIEYQLYKYKDGLIELMYNNPKEELLIMEDLDNIVNINTGNFINNVNTSSVINNVPSFVQKSHLMVN